MHLQVVLDFEYSKTKQTDELVSKMPLLLSIKAQTGASILQYDVNIPDRPSHRCTTI
jgi:hypothetical protein